MSGWTVATLRARPAEDYKFSRYDDSDPVHALQDLVATAEADDDVYAWELDSPHLYVYLNCDRYNWEFAEAFLEGYDVMVRDAVVLGANDTTDIGTARYYPEPDRHTDEYKETQSEDGCHVGKIALAIMTARHGIIARDPFHDYLGRMDGFYLGEGTDRKGEQ